VFRQVGFSFANERFQRMTVKTIFGAVLAVAVGGAALGFASKYRGDCCSNEAKQGIAVTAATSKESMVSHEGECHGGCATGDASGGTECCQTAALSKSVSALSGHGHESECLGSCATSGASESKECCQTAASSKSVSQSGKGHEGECQGDCAHGDSSGSKKCCQDAEKTIDFVASPK
jgi:hypothetical protein